MSNPQFGFSTTAEEVTSHFCAQIRGKTILITGVSPNGIGLSTALALAPHSPSLLILAGRNSSTLSASQITITKQSPSCPTKLLTLDLGSIRTVRSAATELNSWSDVPKLDIVINNAGIMTNEYEKSEDGIERNFATNHIGPWLYTNLIMEKVIAAKGRIIWLSSIGHMYSDVRFDDYNFEDGKIYNPDLAYGASKTANILTARSLTTKLQPRGITSFSVHPGLIITNLIRNVPKEALIAKGFLNEDGSISDKVTPKTLSQGAATTLVAALDPDIAGRSGSYLVDCRIDHEDLYAEWARDGERKGGEKLWALSERLVGERFEY